MSVVPATNFLRARKWLKMAVKDTERTLRSYSQGDYADSAFRTQFAAEKLCKSVIFILGFQFKKTHRPAQIIEKEVLTERSTKMLAGAKKILSELVTTSRYLEEQGVASRYGLEIEGSLLTPDELFNEEKAGKMLTKLNSLLQLFVELVSVLKIQEDELPELKEVVEKSKELTQHEHPS